MGKPKLSVKKIFEIIEKKQLSERQIYEDAGITPYLLAKALEGKDAETLQKLADYVQNPQTARRAAGRPKGNERPAAAQTESKTIDPRATLNEGEIQVPLMGRIAATPFMLADPAAATKWVLGFSRLDAGAFALQIRGDSMAPQYQDGDIIFVRPEHTALTPYLPDGDDGIPFVPYERVARLNGKDCVIGHNGEMTFKRLEIVRGKGPAYDIFIKPLNEAHPTIKVKLGDEFYVDAVCYRSEKDR